ncbi:hypothetical protein PT2222_140417 [Paraburkholderia tropica]
MIFNLKLLSGLHFLQYMSIELKNSL